MFTLTIHTDNDAFQPDPRPELARMLVALADRIESGEDFGRYRNVLDVNGNIVGKVKLEHEVIEEEDSPSNYPEDHWRNSPL